jgi:hypothetical protein
MNYSDFQAPCYTILYSVSVYSVPILANTANVRVGSEFGFLVSRSACVVSSVLRNYMHSRMVC